MAYPNYFNEYTGQHTNPTVTNNPSLPSGRDQDQHANVRFRLVQERRRRKAAEAVDENKDEAGKGNGRAAKE